jgi:hypothetical protein
VQCRPVNLHGRRHTSEHDDMLKYLQVIQESALPIYLVSLAHLLPKRVVFENMKPVTLISLANDWLRTPYLDLGYALWGRLLALLGIAHASTVYRGKQLSLCVTWTGVEDKARALLLVKVGPGDREGSHD